MLRIRHTRGKKAPNVEQFARDAVRFGSAPSSDVAFYGEAAGVAPAHAELRREGDAWVLEDLAGRGTSVFGAPITRRVVAHGDLVQLGGPIGPEFSIEFEAAAAAPEGDGKMELAAAGEIVRAAVARASSPREDKTAAIIARKVDEARRRANLKNALLGLGVVAVLGVSALTISTIWKTDERASALVTEAGLDRPPPPRVDERPAPAPQMPSRVMTGRQIYEENKAALYVLGYTNGRIIGAFCSAFAIGPDLLATNAHCVLSARAKGNVPLIATQNDSGGKVKFHISSTSYHAAYKAGARSADSPDVGLVRISGTMPKFVTMASDAELRALGAGDDAFVIGFPGRVMDPISPTATFLSGRVNRVTGFDGGATTAERSVLIQHDAVTRGGNSGSPIFNQHGHVVAIHAAHLDEEDEQQVNGQRTKVIDASPYRVGMRADLLRGVQRP